MTYGSLFSGIGGLDLGLERAGMRCLWQVEKDEYCSRVLAKHWPGVKRYGDIRGLTGTELEPVDLIAGGFPCTDTSNAGGRTGLDGEHSGLWRDMFRIIRVARLRGWPRFVLVENVPGLLARGMGDVLRDLSLIGFDAEWQAIPACAIGATHERERIFIVAYPRLEGPAQPEQVAPGRWGGSGRDAAHCGDSQVTLADTEQPRLEGYERGILADGQSFARYAARCRSRFAWPASRKDGASESWILRAVHGVPNRMDRVKALGNAVVPQVAQWIGERIMSASEANRG